MLQEVLGRLLDDATVAPTLRLAKVTRELGNKVLIMDEANVSFLLACLYACSFACKQRLLLTAVWADQLRAEVQGWGGVLRRTAEPGAADVQQRSVDNNCCLRRQPHSCAMLEHGSAAFVRFLDAMASRVALKDFGGFAGGLDTQSRQGADNRKGAMLIITYV